WGRCDLWCGSPMPDILTKCPVIGKPLQTGLDTETVNFEDLPSLAIPVYCPHCGQVHLWKPADAWVWGRQKATAALPLRSHPPVRRDRIENNDANYTKRQADNFTVFRVGDRVKLSKIGQSQFPRTSDARCGTIVFIPDRRISGMRVRVLFDGRASPMQIHW